MKRLNRKTDGSRRFDPTVVRQLKTLDVEDLDDRTKDQKSIDTSTWSFVWIWRSPTNAVHDNAFMQSAHDLSLKYIDLLDISMTRGRDVRAHSPRIFLCWCSHQTGRQFPDVQFLVSGLQLLTAFAVEQFFIVEILPFDKRFETIFQAHD